MAAHALTWEWVRPWLPPAFDAREYCRTAAAGVARPRDPARALGARRCAVRGAARLPACPFTSRSSKNSQRAARWRQAGEGRFAATSPVERGERLRIEAYFRWSKVRATARWAKYVVTFDDWLEYIVRKAERHGGEKVELTRTRAALAARVPVAARLRLSEAQGSAEAPVTGVSLALLAILAGLFVSMAVYAAAGRRPRPRRRAARARSSCSARATSSSTGSCGLITPLERAGARHWRSGPTSSTSPASPSARFPACCSRPGGWKRAAGRSPLGGVCDILDGRIARARNIASPFGKFIDACSTASSRCFAFLGFVLYLRRPAARPPSRPQPPSAARCS